MEKKTKQSDYLHIQLRIPPTLHQLVSEYAYKNNLSMNGAMLNLLESALLQSINQRDSALTETVGLLNELKQVQEKLQKDVAEVADVKKLLESYLIGQPNKS